MYQKGPFSKEILSFFKLILCFFTLAIIFRLLFFFGFKSSSELAYSSSDLWKAFYIGLRFDLRAAIILSLPFWFFGYSLKIINALFEEKNRQLFLSTAPHPTIFLKIAFSFLLSLYSIFFLIDFGFYDYLKNRMDASAIDFLKNPTISLQMVSETYPLAYVIPVILAVLISFFLVLHFFTFKEKLFVTGEPVFKTSFKLKLPLFFLLAALAHGKISQYPLRWSEAYFSPNNFISSLGLNPLLYFYDTMGFKEKKYDIDLVKAHYDEVSAYLKVESPNKENLNFKRTIKPVSEAFDQAPNVVVIMMESLAAFKLSHFGQKLPGTPFLDSLIPKGIFFENSFVTSTGTARSIFTVLTGLPDLNSVKTASRNPLLVSQYSAANAFNDYKKSYFIGGSASWGNIRGFVSQSLKGVTIYEEKDFKSGKNDVWGISDLKLFQEAHSFLKVQPASQRQFVFIQTAGYHRPYTIPKDKGSFKLEKPTEKEIAENGFVSAAEYNALRFSDYSIGEFFRLAQKEDYFKNTLFVIYADHGLSHYKTDSVSKGFKRFRLPIMHVPLLFYSSALKIKPEVISKIAFSPDILPSTASLAGKTFVNKSLGRNLFDEKYDDERFALTVSNFSPPVQLRLHDENWITEGNSEGLHGVYPYRTADYTKDFSATESKRQKHMDNLARGLYETTRYLYYHSNQ